MDKRTFIKTSSAVASGIILSKLMGCQTRQPTMRTNWAGNFQYNTENLLQPENVSQLQEMVRAASKIRALGSRHSFNSIADSNTAQVSTAQFSKLMEINTAESTVTVAGGMRYGELCTFLHEKGYALHNLASLPHISIAGACATATHGSGVNNGSLASAVAAIEFVNARGDLLSLSRSTDGETFNSVVVNLGSVGIVTSLKLEIQPTFSMKQSVFLNMPMPVLEKNFFEILSAGYSVSLFTDWKNKNINQVWIKSRTAVNEVQSAAAEFFGAKAASVNMHPLADLSAENCTEQLGVKGPWFERMPHFKMGFTPSSGKELQSEYFIPLENAYKGMMAIEKLGPKISPHLFISEIRAIAQDNYWMSPFYKRPSVAFHFTWKQEWEQVQALLPMIEDALAAFDARPHWGKLFAMKPPVLQSRIEKLSDFKAVISTYDPTRKFQNDFIKEVLFT
jgi:alditol oxidase